MGLLDQVDKHKKILVVDDLPSVRRVLRAALLQFGFDQVEEASTGNDALGKLKAEKFDLVIADCDMPKMNGVDLLCQARGQAGLEEVPFTILASEREEKRVREALKGGHGSCLLRPLSAKLFEQMLVDVFVEAT